MTRPIRWELIEFDRMSDVVYNTATSLSGFIADEQNSLDWLFSVDHAGAPDHDSFYGAV